MPKPLGKKGFYVSTPMVGTVLFLIAALIGATMMVENEARIQDSRSADVRGRHIFMTQAMLADSYDVLLQQTLEHLTAGFIREDYFDIDVREDNWQQSVKSNLIDHYIDELGDTLGLNVQAYAKAYENIPGIKECHVKRVGDYQSTPSAYNSESGDGTLMVISSSYGERIFCNASEPEGQIEVDIVGRPYRVSVRIPKLYDIIRWIIMTAKGAINSGHENIEEPIVSWESPRWLRVKAADNTLVDPSEGRLEEIISNWDGIMDWFSDRMISVANSHVRSIGHVGISLEDFLVEGDEGGTEERGLEDFDISCVEEYAHRDCMPFRLKIRLGDTDCSKGGEPPENTENPFYYPVGEEQVVRCGGKSCPEVNDIIEKEIMRPFDSVCIFYHAYTDSVYPVCKRWQAKEKSVIFKGALKDDSRNYVVAGYNMTLFKFKDQHPDVDVSNVKEDRLTCEMGTEEYDFYKDNVRRLLEGLTIKIGSRQVAGSPIRRWVDLGSSLERIEEQKLNEIYKNVYGQGVLPMPCFIKGVKPSLKCTSAEAEEKPRIEMEVDWEETRMNCINRINDLCQGLCGGNALPDYTETFCKSLFPEREDVVGGYGRLMCDCNQPDGTFIEVGAGSSRF